MTAELKPVPLHEEQASDKPVPKPATEPVVLPNSRQAAAWRRAMDALLESLERDEARAMADLKQARDRAKAARLAAGRMRQIRDLVQLAGGTTGTPTAAEPSTGRGWPAGNFKQCSGCGTSDPSRPHFASGRCRPCHDERKAAKAATTTEESPRDH